nr:MAG TPA_asm: hypothetical protein [Caudoviricetes sp.]
MANLLNYSGEKTLISIGDMQVKDSLGSKLLTVTLTFDDNSVFASGNDLCMFFGDYTMSTYVYNQGSISPASDFLSTLQRYWDIRKSEYEKIKTAITEEYNPINNYSMEEKHTGTDTTASKNSGTDITTDTHTGTDTLAKTGDVENAKGTTQTNTAGITSKTTNAAAEITSVNQVSAYDSNDFVNHDKNTTATPETTQTVANSGADTIAYGGKDTTTNNLTDTTTYNNTLTSNIKYGHNVDNTTTYDTLLTRVGNIGVTTSQQMIESEYILRLKHSLIELFLTEFIRNYCF